MIPAPPTNGGDDGDDEDDEDEDDSSAVSGIASAFFAVLASVAAVNMFWFLLYINLLNNLDFVKHSIFHFLYMFA